MGWDVPIRGKEVWVTPGFAEQWAEQLMFAEVGTIRSPMWDTGQEIPPRYPPRDDWGLGFGTEPGFATQMPFKGSI